MSLASGVTRRDFTLGVGVACGLVAFGGVSKAFAGDGALLRPPGAQDEDRLLSRCIKCDRCWSICPLDCLKRADLSDGVLNARTPIIDFHRGYCDFCGKCQEVCPTGAIGAFDPSVERIGTARIDEEMCLSYVKGSCDKCLAACRYDALVANENGHPVVVADLCNGCGECVFACDVNLFGSYDGSKLRAIEVERSV